MMSNSSSPLVLEKHWCKPFENFAQELREETTAYFVCLHSEPFGKHEVSTHVFSVQVPLNNLIDPTSHIIHATVIDSFPPSSKKQGRTLSSPLRRIGSYVAQYLRCVFYRQQHSKNIWDSTAADAKPDAAAKFEAEPSNVPGLHGPEALSLQAFVDIVSADPIQDLVNSYLQEPPTLTGGVFFASHKQLIKEGWQDLRVLEDLWFPDLNALFAEGVLSPFKDMITVSFSVIWLDHKVKGKFHIDDCRSSPDALVIISLGHLQHLLHRGGGGVDFAGGYGKTHYDLHLRQLDSQARLRTSIEVPSASVYALEGAALKAVEHLPVDRAENASLGGKLAIRIGLRFRTGSHTIGPPPTDLEEKNLVYKRHLEWERHHARQAVIQDVHVRNSARNSAKSSARNSSWCVCMCVSVCVCVCVCVRVCDTNLILPE